MKFAKLLEETKRFTDAGWREHWINYKGLKKLIGMVPPAAKEASSAAANAGAVITALSSIPEEVAFFSGLRHEVSKISSFFSAQQAACREALADVERHFVSIQALEHISEAQAAPFLARVIGCYSSLVELENFAVMNYAGCGKILKKHDKVTGFTTKAQYMAKVVDRLEWASYPRLLKMLEHVDGIYRLVLSKLATDTRARFLGSQEQSRLVSLGDMKRVASSEKLAVMASAATGLDAAAAAAARTHMVIPGSTGGSAAAPAGPMSVTQRTAELQRRAAGDQSDSDDDEPDREAATASAAGPTSPGAPQTRVTPDDRRQTELDIAAFIAGVARTPMHGAGLADPARHRSSSVPVAPAFVASLPMRAPTTIVPPTVGFPSPVPSMPASSSSSSSSSAAAAASAAAAPTSDDSACQEEERFKRLDESLAEIQSLVNAHLHALRAQFQTARELSAKLAACSRADTVRVSRILSASTDSGSVSVSESDPDAADVLTAGAAGTGRADETAGADGGCVASLVAPAEYFDEPEAHEPHRLHAALRADHRRLSAVAEALARQQRAHEALGAATVQAAERLLGAAALAPAARLRDALAKLRPTMEKRRRNHTDVAAYARRVEAADAAAARASSKRRPEAEAEAEVLRAGDPAMARLEAKAVQEMHAGLDAGLVREAPAPASSGPRELPDDPEAIAAASRAVPPGPVGVATHAYAAREADELALLPGQRVTILSRDDDGWWLGSVGEAGDRSEGRFPFTYIRVTRTSAPDGGEDDATSA
ncbi:hypothetical protein FNF29_02179 [Cafeteria roenbergensis]|uniref:SH3 domain-containing protein n=1 Tax=Cafeteria roenbergensis TaxID=33653 RepID=A0A5A8CPK2_CAFRO|nr:hypothetical protein FNF29_02179 [Cafeteria roenbergensis]|eukprot:KAA0154648.1 hypothetical protein FNF29_02179 [Cafeteria roenbergensis]